MKRIIASTYSDQDFLDIVDQQLYQQYENCKNYLSEEYPVDMDSIETYVLEHIEMLSDDNLFSKDLPDNWRNLTSKYVEEHYDDYEWDKYGEYSNKEYNVHIELTDGDVCDFIVSGAQWNPLYKILEQSDLVEHYVVD